MNNIKKEDEDNFAILRKIDQSSKISQREMARELGFSLGKLNYCIKALKTLSKLNLLEKNFKIKNIIDTQDILVELKKQHLKNFMKKNLGRL